MICTKFAQKLVLFAQNNENKPLLIFYKKCCKSYKY